MNKNTIIALILGLVIGGLAVWLLIGTGGTGETFLTKKANNTATYTATQPTETLNSKSNTPGYAGTITTDSKSKASFSAVTTKVNNTAYEELITLIKPWLDANEPSTDTNNLYIETGFWFSRIAPTPSTLNRLEEYYRYPGSIALAYGAPSSSIQLADAKGLISVANAKDAVNHGKIDQIKGHVRSGFNKCDWETILTPPSFGGITIASESEMQNIVSGVVTALNQKGFFANNNMNSNANGEVYVIPFIFLANKSPAELIPNNASLKHPDVWGAWVEGDDIMTSGTSKKGKYNKIRIHYQDCESETFISIG